MPRSTQFPWYPFKLRPSSPRPLEQCIRERDVWDKWDTPNRRISQAEHRDTRSWKRVPDVDDARVILNDIMVRVDLPRSDNIDIRPFKQGSTNVLFTVTCRDWGLTTNLLRITMPYDPYY